ncbi:hypothetical protein ASPCAL03941 [Aspergillus calidoustus]|uniref:Uncharacterized protein n=1 Tax=Aspergillus calidoustus TaxID=454130 RepID=A0A0U5C4C2_ASPCI|nr:hypothetical protein ASPCAL03941 [Aspergillus calidoustus]
MAHRPRVTFEKSRVVRRRYQRSNQRFQFTASQIARIDREEERKNNAEKLREKEKRRIKEKQKRAEKEAKAREERMRLGIPDPNARKVPASQPLLFNFIKKGPPAKPTIEEDENDLGDESDDTAVASTVVPSDFDCDLELDDDTLGFEEEGIDDLLMELEDPENSDQPVAGKSEGRQPEASWITKDDQEDEFSDCSFDEEVLKETESIATKASAEQVPIVPRPPKEESFTDGTALILEQFTQDFDPSSSFDEALAQLDQLTST